MRYSRGQFTSKHTLKAIVIFSTHSFSNVSLRYAFVKALESFSSKLFLCFSMSPFSSIWRARAEQTIFPWVVGFICLITNDAILLKNCVPSLIFTFTMSRIAAYSAHFRIAPEAPFSNTAPSSLKLQCNKNVAAHISPAFEFTRAETNAASASTTSRFSCLSPFKIFSNARRAPEEYGAAILVSCSDEFLSNTRARTHRIGIVFWKPSVSSNITSRRSAITFDFPSKETLRELKEISDMEAINTKFLELLYFKIASIWASSDANFANTTKDSFSECIRNASTRRFRGADCTMPNFSSVSSMAFANADAIFDWLSTSKQSFFVRDNSFATLNDTALKRAPRLDRLISLIFRSTSSNSFVKTFASWT